MSSGSAVEVITPEDHGGDLWIVVVVCLAFSAIAVASRFGSKAFFHYRPQLDDYVLTGAFVLLVIQNALVMESLVLGAGKDADLVSPAHVRPMMNCFVASQAFYVAAVHTIKISLLLLISRLFQKPMKLYWALFIVLGLASLLATTAGCTTFECSNNNPIARWVFYTVFDVITELILLYLAFLHLRDLGMRRWRKFKVMFSFSTRLLPVLFSILALCSIASSVSDPTKAPNGSAAPLTGPTTAVVNPSIFQQFELVLSISIASILPCFRLLFQVLEDETTMLTTRGGNETRNDTAQEPNVAAMGTFAKVRSSASHSDKASDTSSRDTSETYGQSSTSEAQRSKKPHLPPLSSTSLIDSSQSRKEKGDSGV